MKLPTEIGHLFHNYEPGSIDPERHAGLVIHTVLAGGTWDQILWLFQTYGKHRVRQVFLEDCRGRRSLPNSTRRLWSLVFLGDPGACADDPHDPLDRWRWRGRP